AGRYFILWLGVGLDAQVAHDVEPHRDIRRTLGNLTYLVTTIALSFTLRGTRLTISVDDRSVRLRTLMVVVTNAQLYGPALRLAPNARLDDGWLEVYIFKGGNILDVLRHFGSMVIGRHTRDPKVEIYRARRIEIRGESPQPLHMDGEPMGNIPVTIEVVPRALRVMVPLQAPASLFEEGTHPHQEELNLAQRIAAHVRQGGERWLEEGKQIRHDLERRLHRPTQ
ncbi:MAG TPA: hypothetical protein GX702_01685, partial [Chloroflexi bacterium]|nr:hypothetical protein [Chloroflexota bacterium]